MLKSVCFLIGCIALCALAWSAFWLLGQYAFLLMLVITLLLLLAKTGKAKFDKGKNGR